MSDKDSDKSLSKPKVRFSQKSLKTTNENAARPLHGPVIRDIVTLKKPITIVRSQNVDQDDQTSKSGEKSTKSTDQERFAENSSNPTENSVNIIDQLQEQTQNLKITNKPIINVKNHNSTESVSSKLSSSKSSKSGRKPSVTFAEQEPKVVENVLQNRGQNNENISKPPRTIEVPLLLINDETSSKSSDIQLKVHDHVSCSENKENVIRKLSSNRSTTKLAPSKSESVKKLNKTNSKPPAVTSKLTQSQPSKKSLPVSKRLVPLSCREPKIPVAGTMACLKPRKKCDKILVKKDVVKNRAGPLSNIYVGPGLSKIKSPTTSVIDVYKRPDVLSSNKLIKPEFNSIVGTMRKLQEIKKKKIVNEVDSLPNTYKNLIMGKVIKKFKIQLCKIIDNLC